jgi:hypothetical protein
VRKFLGVPNVTGKVIQLCGITDTRSTPENGCDSWSFPIDIRSLLKVARLVRLSAAPLSIKTWYSLMLTMDGETSSGSCSAPTMLLGQSEASKPIGVSIHLRCGAAVVISRRKVLMMRRDIMFQEPPNMTWSTLQRSLSLDSESEWS